MGVKTASLQKNCVYFYTGIMKLLNFHPFSFSLYKSTESLFAL
jgi:hypothetical protein